LTGLPVRGARFHFDPLHDASGIPSTDELVEWAMERAEAEGSPLSTSLASVRTSRKARLSPLQRIAELMPPVRRRRDAGLLETVTASMRRGLSPARDMMEEFGVDLRTHRFLRLTLEALASYAMMAPIEDEQRRFLADNPDFPTEDVDRVVQVLDQIDTEQRMAASLAGIRAGLENDALMALMTSEELIHDRPRHLAAMKAAIDEIRQIEMRERLVDMISKVEAGRS
jgi:hypothetical protein